MEILKLMLSVILISNTQTHNDSSKYYNTFKEEYKSSNKITTEVRIELQDFFEKQPLQLIDTILVSNIGLIDKSFSHEEFGLKTLQDIRCRYIAGFDKKFYDINLITYFTSEAGDGNRVLQIRTYTKEGKVINSLVFGIKYQHDFDIDPKQYITLTDDFEIVYEDTENVYVQTDSTTTQKLKLLKVNKRIEKYKIEEDGHIHRL